MIVTGGVRSQDRLGRSLKKRTAAMTATTLKATVNRPAAQASAVNATSPASLRTSNETPISGQDTGGSGNGDGFLLAPRAFLQTRLRGLLAAAQVVQELLALAQAALALHG